MDVIMYNRHSSPALPYQSKAIHLVSRGTEAGAAGDACLSALAERGLS